MRAVIFDFDGTIVDSLPALIHLYERMGGKRSHSQQKDISELRYKSMLQVAHEMHIPIWRIAWLAVFGRRMFRRHLRSISVYDGMQQVIADLHQRGTKIFVVSTNRTSNIRAYLSWHRLDGYFDGIYGGANYFNKAHAMTKAVKQFAFEPNDVWCIGDEKVDIRSARAAGFHAVSVTWGYASRTGLQNQKPDHLVDTVAQLRTVLKLPKD